MKICITSQGPELTSQTDPRFGRARYFIIYDDQTGEFEAIDNAENVGAAGGAGVQSAQTVVERDCKWVLSGHIGPRAMSVLSEADVKVAVGAEGTVQDAIEAFRAGKLTEAAGPDVAPHW